MGIWDDGIKTFGRDNSYPTRARRGLISCSQFCSQPEGIPETIWTRYEYMESENSELNSIAA
jgi:hypothetical protein